jgi:hypothetical protein
MTRYLVWSPGLGVERVDAIPATRSTAARSAEDFVGLHDDGSAEHNSRVRVYVADGDHVQRFDVRTIRTVTYEATEVLDGR